MLSIFSCVLQQRTLHYSELWGGLFTSRTNFLIAKGLLTQESRFTIANFCIENFPKVATTFPDSLKDFTA